MAPGSTLTRVATRFVFACDVAGKPPEFRTTCEFGSPMNLSMAWRLVPVYVAGNGKAGWIDTWIDSAIRIIVIGNLDRDPEMRYSPSGQAITSFSADSNRRYTSGAGEQREETAKGSIPDVSDRRAR